MDDFRKAFGELIRELRRSKGVTQAELGYLTQMDPMTISRIERGVFLPSIISLFAIAHALQEKAVNIVWDFEEKLAAEGIELVLEEPIPSAKVTPKRKGKKAGALKKQSDPPQEGKS